MSEKYQPKSIEPSAEPGPWRSYAFALALMAVSTQALALTFNTTFVDEWGCAIYNFVVHTLGGWAFVIVIACALIAGLWGKLDISTIIMALVVFGLLGAIGSYYVSSNSNSTSGIQTCMR